MPSVNGRPSSDAAKRPGGGEAGVVTGVAIIGCGYVADFYVATLPNHPELVIRGVYDRDPVRLAAFSRHHGLRAYPDAASLLADPAVELVLNLTNPHSHFAVSRQALEAGKHVYSEKPLALELDEARELVELAARRRLSLRAAPATHLGEAARATADVLSRGDLGSVRVVYAELDDGMVFRTGCEGWRSASGAPWPAADEFGIGCTLQHASYYVTWLCELFGPVRSVTAFASRQIDDKGVVPTPGGLADDFSVSCLTFDNGVVGRLTCGLVAPRDRRMRIVGDRGVLTVQDGWDTRSRVHIDRPDASGPAAGWSKVTGALGRRVPQWLRRQSVKFTRPRYRVPVGHPGRLDYARGPAAQAAALQAGEWSGREADLALHVTEVTLTIAAARQNGMGRPMTSSFR